MLQCAIGRSGKGIDRIIAPRRGQIEIANRQKTIQQNLIGAIFCPSREKRGEQSIFIPNKILTTIRFVVSAVLCPDLLAVRGAFKSFASRKRLIDDKVHVSQFGLGYNEIAVSA